MKTKESGRVQTATNTSPSSATTAVGATGFKGDALRRADFLVIDAEILGGTGGALDVYLQRKLANNSWADWVHFPQVAAGGTKRYVVGFDGCGYTATGSEIIEVGRGNDATPGVVLAANKAVNIMPGDEVRVVFVAGAGTSAGAITTITITPYTVLG